MTLKFEEWTQDPNDPLPQVIVIWALSAFCFCYALAWLKLEGHQFIEAGIRDYYTDPFNIIDSGACMLTLCSLSMMVWTRGASESNARLNLDAIQAQAMLFCYL